MAEKLSPKELVDFEEILMRSIFEQKALINLLEKKGLITKLELLEEIRELEKKHAKAAS